ncbi:MAG: hypothetical protein PWP31_617 [Clostridia bacterium]|nr:hypothetical protein [Clostridia bacterium]
MLRRLAIFFMLFLTFFTLNGCTQKPVVAAFKDFEDQIVGLNLYESQQENEEPRQIVNVSDKKIVQDLLELMGQLPKTSNPPSPWSGEKKSLVFKFRQKGQIVASKKYPFLYKEKGPGYLQLEDGWHQISPKFITYFLTLSQYPEASSQINSTDAAFLKKYGWTILYKIKTYNGRLPDKIIHESGEYPVSLYYAYNNELSKDIDLDLTPYLGKSVTVNLYKIKEPLPAFMKPRQDANRAVIVKDGVNIIGAWLDAGRHNAFACSLKGRKLEDITNMPWGEWLDQYINHDNPQEELISQMDPEEVIRTYYEAINHKDYRTAHACETRKRLIGYLFRNMDNNRLYNYSYDVNDDKEINNISSVKIIRIRPYNEPNFSKSTNNNQHQPENKSDVKKYVVELDVEVKQSITYDRGHQIRFITLRQETPSTGWRIDGISTGP